MARRLRSATARIAAALPRPHAPVSALGADVTLRRWKPSSMSRLGWQVYGVVTVGTHAGTGRISFMERRRGFGSLAASTRGTLSAAAVLSSDKGEC